jgi:radical S-adenosyl methionine domain-containing protein 2
MCSRLTYQVPVETVNFHVWQPCNMHCRFCFARFRDVRAEVLPDGHLPESQALRLVSMLAEAGFQKITFSGGEPFLCPWLMELIAAAKQAGMTTSVVTNGSLVTDELLTRAQGLLDWMVISIDSAHPETLRLTGRLTSRRVLSGFEYLTLCREVTSFGIFLKINTVVSRANWREDMVGLITRARPIRWKAMQILPIAGQNSRTIGTLSITDEQFWSFVDRHRSIEHHGVAFIGECNDQMIGSYAMVDPAGRFFDNIKGTYTYSAPILLCGIHAAIQEVSISREKFLARGGLYDWTSGSRGCSSSQGERVPPKPREHAGLGAGGLS